MATWRPKLAQAFNTCNPMGLHTTGEGNGLWLQEINMEIFEERDERDDSRICRLRDIVTYYAIYIYIYIHTPCMYIYIYMYITYSG